MSKCLIIEDDYLSALEIKIKLEEVGYQSIEIVLDLASFKGANKLKSFDIILSDVKLGNDLLAFEVLRKYKYLPPIIFFSIHTDNELYKKSSIVNPYVYLAKPVDRISLKSAIDGALRDKRKTRKRDLEVVNGNVFVRSKGKLESIDPSEIMFIHSEGNYCHIHLEDRKTVIRSSLCGIKETMNSIELIQVHRSYLINITRVNNIDINKGEIHLPGASIPIGRKYKKELLSLI